MIACYCRVSSRRQKHESQKVEIQRWLRNNRVSARRVVWFEDIETGRTLTRPAFECLQRAIFAGTVEMVVVWKLDRLSRRQRDGINLLADWCDRGVRIVVVTQQIDLRGRRKGTTKAKPVRARTLRSRGLTASEIANALKISPRTVFRYLASRRR
jgi:DNA invertase Pin-like site-specific DNA recombinase